MDFLIVPTVGFKLLFGHSQAPPAATAILRGDDQSKGGVDRPSDHDAFPWDEVPQTT